MERVSNMHVIIFSRDAVFARMLTLEITAIGISVGFSDDLSMLRGGCGENTITVVDSDIWQSVMNTTDLDITSPQIEFGYGETPVSSAPHYLRRPFRLDTFISLVRMISGDTDITRSDIANAVARAVKPDAKQTELGLTYDNRKNSFRYNGEELSFTETEHSLLLSLYKNRGKEVSREQLLSEVWGREGEGERKTNLTDVYIRYIREKLDDRFGVRLIYSVRGKGYKLI